MKKNSPWETKFPPSKGGTVDVNYRDYTLFADGKGFGLPASGFRIPDSGFLTLVLILIPMPEA